MFKDKTSFRTLIRLYIYIHGVDGWVGDECWFEGGTCHFDLQCWHIYLTCICLMAGVPTEMTFSTISTVKLCQSIIVMTSQRDNTMRHDNALPVTCHSRCASHRTMHMSYRSKTYTWNDVIIVKRSTIRVFFSYFLSHNSDKNVQPYYSALYFKSNLYRTGEESRATEVGRLFIIFLWFVLIGFPFGTRV